MLPTINLQLTGPSDPSGLTASGTGSVSPFAAGSPSPVASFADLLRQPVLVALPPDSGQSLPLDGSLLPAAAELVDAASRLLAASPDGGPTVPATPALPSAMPGEKDPLISLSLVESGVDAVVDAEDSAPFLPAMTLPEGRPTAVPTSESELPARTTPTLRTELPTAVLAADAAQSQSDRNTPREPAANVLADTASRSVETSASRAERMVGGVETLVPTGGTQTTPNVSQAAPLPTFVAGTSGGAVPQSPQVQTSIGLPVMEPGWGEVLNERIVFMSAQKIQSAEIRLSPAELGPIRVSVSVDDGATNVSFHAQQAVTREAIETALPRLREMLSEQGLSLGNTSVTDQGTGGDDRRLDAEGRLVAPTTGLPGEGGDDDVSTTAPAARVLRGLVDTFV